MVAVNTPGVCKLAILDHLRIRSGLDEYFMFVNRQFVPCASFQRYKSNDDWTNMMLITDQQRRVLVEHAMECNSFSGEKGQPNERRFAEVIVDLAMDRPVADLGLLIGFLWQRVTLAVEAGLSRKDHWVWSAAVQLLDQLGENLEEIFVGRSTEPGCTRLGSGDWPRVPTALGIDASQ